MLCEHDLARNRCGDPMEIMPDVKSIITESLQLGARADALTAETPLLGNLPELDSMAVVTVITALEEHYGFFVEDDEISAETFTTLGTLTQFVSEKLAE